MGGWVLNGWEGCVCCVSCSCVFFVQHAEWGNANIGWLVDLGGCLDSAGAAGRVYMCAYKGALKGCARCATCMHA